MKSVLGAVMASVLLSVVARAEEPVQVDPSAAEAETLGLTQGKFLLQVVHEVGAEGFFEGAVTADIVGERFANLGLAPDAGWQISEDLTRDVLAQAYNRLVSTMGEQSSVEDTEEDGAEPVQASSEWTIAELVEKIMEAVKDALVNIQCERQSVSPSRPSWR